MYKYVENLYCARAYVSNSISGYTLYIYNKVSLTVAILNPRWSLIILRLVTY